MNSNSPTTQPFSEGENADLLEALACNGLSLLPWQNYAFGTTTPDFAIVQQPKYPLGTRCRWIPTPQTDWGTVIGQVYAPESKNPEGTHHWYWLYLLLLDADSPSRSWVIADWVDEADLELLPVDQDQSQTDQEVL